jgi:hypothetical protein
VLRVVAHANANTIPALIELKRTLSFRILPKSESTYICVSMYLAFTTPARETNSMVSRGV